METTRLGRTDLEVSRLCFGTWQFGGDWGELEAEDAKAAVRKALDLGVTFFDTAQGYGWGDSEKTLAQALGDDIRRDDVVVATKGGLRMEGGGFKRDASPGCSARGWRRASATWGSRPSTCGNCTGRTPTRRWRRPPAR